MICVPSYEELDEYEAFFPVYTLNFHTRNERDSNLKIDSTTDQYTSLTDADLVINTAAVCNQHHLRAMRELTGKHGYLLIKHPFSTPFQKRPNFRTR